MSGLEIKNITVGYDKEIDVLKNVSLHIDSNESVSVIGANGAGKSTLVKTISGLVKPKVGDILYNGKSLLSLKPHEIVQLGIVHVPEDGGTFKSLSIEENLNISCLDSSTLEKNKELVYKFFPALVQKRNDRADSLSGGQRKMLSVGKAIMANPKFLLLDDISMGLAPKVVYDLYDMLKELTDELKIPTLVIEQIVEIALTFSSRSYCISQGEVVMSGKSSDLINDEEVKRSYLGI